MLFSFFPSKTSFEIAAKRGSINNNELPGMSPEKDSILKTTTTSTNNNNNKSNNNQLTITPYGDLASPRSLNGGGSTNR